MVISTIKIDDYVTTAQFADAVGISVHTAKAHCQRKRLDAVKLGTRSGIWMIKKSEISRFKRENRRGRPPSK